MKYLILLCALLLGSCVRHNAHAPRPKSEPIGAVVPPVDKEFVRIDSPNPVENGPSRRLDSVVAQPRRTVLDKILGRTPAPYSVKSTGLTVGKKSTVNNYYAPATVTTTTVGKKSTAATAEGATATTIGKAKGPTAIGDSATATDNTKAGQRGGAAATAPHATATATTQKGGWPWWLYVAIAGGAGLLIYRGYKRFISV